jgi:hypothetical protein
MVPLRTADEWSEQYVVKIIDPDGWRNAGIDWDAHITEDQFIKLMTDSTIQLMIGHWYFNDINNF